MTNNMHAAARIGVSQFTTLPWPFERDVETYAALGFDGIEVVEDKLDNDCFAEQMQSIAAAGLEICGVQPSVRTFFSSRMVPEPAALADRVACLRKSIERLGRYAPGAPFITNAGAHPRGDMAEAMRVVARELKALAPVAADYGVRLALEPLNPTSVNVESAIWTVDQALTIIEHTGRDEVGLCLDYWNIWQNQDVKRVIERAGDRIFAVEASDWRTPRSIADRIVPGDGETPLAALMRATRGAGYDGIYAVEIFSDGVPDSLYAGDMEAMLTRCQSGMRDAWSASLYPAD